MWLIVWQFETEETHAQAFEQAYGAEGVWAQFFRQSPGYVRTQLARDGHEPGHYLTLDYWKTAQDFQTFKEAHAEAYRQLDHGFAALIRREHKIGEFIVD